MEKSWHELFWKAFRWIWIILGYTKLWHKQCCCIEDKPEETGVFITFTFGWKFDRDFWYSFGCSWSNITCFTECFWCVVVICSSHVHTVSLYLRVILLNLFPMQTQWTTAATLRMELNNFCFLFLSLFLKDPRFAHRWVKLKGLHQPEEFDWSNPERFNSAVFPFSRDEREIRFLYVPQWGRLLSDWWTNSRAIPKPQLGFTH